MIDGVLKVERVVVGELENPCVWGWQLLYRLDELDSQTLKLRFQSTDNQRLDIQIRMVDYGIEL